MSSALTKKFIAVGFKAWAATVRLKHTVRHLGALKLGKVNHFTIPVHDLERAREFYCNVLGAAYFMQVNDETFRRFGRPPAANGGDGSHHVSVFVSDSTRIDLFLQSRGGGAPELGHPHYAFTVAPRNLLKWKRRLGAVGIPVDGPLQLGPPGQASLYFNDPFGNHLELATMGFTGEVEIRPPEMRKIVWTSQTATEPSLRAAG
jgi:catechol 2,3-dioxygenase-like lactoylglutathione lyase family enzyme